MAELPERPVFAVSEALAHLDAEGIRIARQLRHSLRKKVGLLPVTDEVVVWPLALQLALGLERLTAKKVGIVDAACGWPTLVASEGAPRAPEEDEGADPFVGTAELTPFITLAAPRRVAPRGAKVQLLTLVVRHLESMAPPFEYTLIDLTGMHHRQGEFLEALELTEGVLVVGTVGQTTDKAMTRIYEEIPEQLNLGAVLVG